MENVIRELKEERAKLDAAIVALEGLNHKKVVRRGGARVMSASARRRIAAAQRARWAAWKKGRAS